MMAVTSSCATYGNSGFISNTFVAICPIVLSAIFLLHFDALIIYSFRSDLDFLLNSNKKKLIIATIEIDGFFSFIAPYISIPESKKESKKAI